MYLYYRVAVRTFTCLVSTERAEKGISDSDPEFATEEGEDRGRGNNFLDKQ